MFFECLSGLKSTDGLAKEDAFHQRGKKASAECSSGAIYSSDQPPFLKASAFVNLRITGLFLEFKGESQSIKLLPSFFSFLSPY